MDPYVISLAAGATGLMAMAVGGVAHLGSAGHGHGSHAGHAGPIGHASHGARSGRAAGRAGNQASSWLQSLLSPRVFFSLLVGFGAGGVLAEPLGAPLQVVAALLGAVVFEALIVGPLWRLLFRFESRPALTLESAIEDDGRAVTGFDANGCGLVALEVDGQIIQLLATLNADERARGVRVRAGDVVRVDDVDPARGRCIVRTSDR